MSRSLQLMSVVGILGLPLGMLSVALLARLYGVGRAIEVNLLAQTVPAMLGGVLESNATVVQGVDVAEGAARDSASLAAASGRALASSLVAALALVVVSAATGPLVVRALAPYAVEPGAAALAAGLGGVMFGAGIVHASATSVALATGDGLSPALSKLAVRVGGLASLYPLFRLAHDLAPNLAPALGAILGAAVQLWAIRSKVRAARSTLAASVRGALALLFTDRRVILFRLLDQVGSNAPALLASRFPPGTFVIYSYAQRFSVPLQLLLGAVVTVLVPNLARAKVERGTDAADSETRALAETLTGYGAAIAALGAGAIPLAAFLFLGARLGGAISLPVVTLTACILIALAPVSLAQSVVGSYLWAHRRFDIALKVACVNVVVSVAGSVASTFGAGAVGLACAQTAAYVASFTVIVALLRRDGVHVFAVPVARLFRFAVATVAAIAIAYACAHVVARGVTEVALVLSALGGAACAAAALGRSALGEIAGAVRAKLRPVP